MRSEWTFGGKRIALSVGDITAAAVDAIVNAANSSLMGGGGVDGAIHRAGGPSIMAECRQITGVLGPLPVGEAVITCAGDLPAGNVIHTVGPVWKGGGAGEEDALAGAYRNSMRVAAENGVETIAFPSISTGAFGYPVELAAPVAVRTVAESLEGETPVREVSFVLFDERIYSAYDRALAGSRSSRLPA